MGTLLTWLLCCVCLRSLQLPLLSQSLAPSLTPGLATVLHKRIVSESHPRREVHAWWERGVD